MSYPRRLAVMALALAGVSVVAAAACSNRRSHPGGGRLELAMTAANAGAAASNFAPEAPAFAPHTLDSSLAHVQSFLSGPAETLKINVRTIIIEGAPGTGTLLFGTHDGSGPGVDVELSNGTIDLASAGISLLPAPPGHYSRVIIWISRVVKVKGCLRGSFNALAATSGSAGGVPYTTDALTAGTHQFCTIASKGLLNFFGAANPVDVGSDAEYEAQTTPEEVEIDLGMGFPLDANGTLPTSADDVRNASDTLGILQDFEVTADTPVKLTVVVDMNRMLQFFPNILPGFPMARPGAPPGTSFFYIADFNHSLGLFAGTPGSIQGYQITSEVCTSGSCVAGSPPDNLAREWMTLILDSSGAIGAGLIQADDAVGALQGLVLPDRVAAGTTAGTLRLSVGHYDSAAPNAASVEDAYIDDFRLKMPGDPEDSGEAFPISGQGPVNGHGPFPLWYTRRL